MYTCAVQSIKKKIKNNYIVKKKQRSPLRGPAVYSTSNSMPKAVNPMPIAPSTVESALTFDSLMRSLLNSLAELIHLGYIRRLSNTD